MPNQLYVPGLGYATDFEFPDLCNALRDNILLADKVFLPFSAPLSIHQQATFRQYEEGSFLFHQACRGGSKSYTTARFILVYGLTHELSAVLTAPTYRQALLVFNYIVTLIKENSTPRNPIPISKELDGKIIGGGNLEARMRFKNGTIIKALPMGKGEKIRGERADILHCDEFYQMDKTLFRNHLLPFLYKPIVSGDQLGLRPQRPSAKLVVTTSAEYEDCFAYHFLTNTILPKVREEDVKSIENPAYRRKYFVIDWNIDDLQEFGFQLDPDVIELQIGDASEEEKQRALYNKWAGTAGQFFPSNMRERISSPDVRVETEAKEGFSYAMTVDVAIVKGGDDFVIDVFKFIGDRRMGFVNSYWDNGLSDDDKAAKIHEFNDKFHPEIIYMDKGGGGLSVVSSLSKRKLILSNGNEVVISDPIVLHDEDRLNGQPILVLNRPTDEKVRDAFAGERSRLGQLISTEDVLASLMYEGLRNIVLRDDPLIIVPTEADFTQDEYARSEVQILDNINESLAQLRHLSIKTVENADGSRSVVRTKLSHMPTYTWKHAKKDGAVAFCYGFIPYLLHYKDERGAEEEEGGFIIEQSFVENPYTALFSENIF